VSTERHGELLIVTVSGDVDLAIAPALESALVEAATDEPAGAVQVDLSAVTFLDSSGIAALVRGRHAAEEHGVGYRVTGASGAVREILELTGVWDYLSGDDPDQAW
jgi:anti-anti-sigma factor